MSEFVEWVLLSLLFAGSFSERVFLLSDDEYAALSWNRGEVSSRLWTLEGRT